MKMKTMFGLAAIGGLYYAHRQRGGVMTTASIKDSLLALRETAGNKLQEFMTKPSADKPKQTPAQPNGSAKQHMH